MSKLDKFNKAIDIVIMIIGGIAAGILFTFNIVALLVAIVIGAVWRQ